MPWVYGWPLPPERAIELAKRYKLVKDSDLNECQCLFAASKYIANQASWENVLGCWLEDGDIGFIFAAYVDWRNRAHPPKRIPASEIEPLWKWYKLAKFIIIRGKPQWYRYNDCAWDPTEGERWKGTDPADDEEEEAYSPESENGEPGEDYKEEGDSDEATSEGDYQDAPMSSRERDSDKDPADGESTPRVVASTLPESVDALAPQFDVQCTI